jgi:outer membrane lipoprotein-sorting protein
MKTGRLRQRILPRVLALSVAAAAAVARGGDPGGETILRNVEARLAALRDYTVTLDVVADIERLNVPPMHATMYFKQPDKIHLDAEGFALLPREGLQPNVGKLLSRYAVARVGKDSLDGISVLKVTLVAKSDRSFPRSLTLYVNPQRWTTERIVTSGAADRLATISFSYVQVEGIWLPGGMTAAFALAPPDSTGIDLPAGPLRPQQTPRNGTVTVRYSNYRLNTGLSDDIFAKDTPAR